MARPQEFTISNHALERLMERGGKVTAPIRKFTSVRERQHAAHALLCEGKETKAFTNDTRFMTNIYEKYGYDRKYVAFLAHDLIFLGVVNERSQVIVTVLAKDEHYVNHFKNAKK